MQLDLNAILLAIALAAAGAGFIWLLRRFSITVTVGDWAIFYTPIIVYLIFSGALTEFKGFGFETKFNARADAPLPSDIITSISPNYIVSGDAPAVDISKEAYFGRAQRVIAVRTDVWDKMTDAQRVEQGLRVATSIYQSFLAGSFEGLVVLDPQLKPLGIFEASYFLDLLRLPLDRMAVDSSLQDFVLSQAQIRARVLETQLWAILRHPKIRAEAEANQATARYDISRKDALKKMVTSRFEVLVITDASGRFMGVLPKRHLVDQLLVDLIEASKLR